MNQKAEKSLFLLSTEGSGNAVGRRSVVSSAGAGKRKGGEGAGHLDVHLIPVLSLVTLRSPAPSVQGGAGSG